MKQDAKKYILDSNVFIDAKNTYYAFDICPAFWEFIIASYSAKLLFSIDEVERELFKKAGKEDLKQWIENNLQNTGFFLDTKDRMVLQKYIEIGDAVNRNAQYFRKAKAEFFDGSDLWLIAYAAVYGFVVVTHEQKKIGVKKRVPIPNVCDEFNVDYCNIFEMLKELGAQFMPAP